MLRIVDLELWSKPRMLPVPHNGKDVAANCRAGTGLSEQVVLGLNFVADDTDVANLGLSLSAGELSQSEFSEFCATHDLVPDACEKTSAAHFLAYAFGQPLAWLHFSAEPEGLAQATLVLRWAEGAGYCVVAGQAELPLGDEELKCLWPQ